jgi:hypothetical protein
MSGTWYRRQIRDPGTQAYIFFKFVYYWVYIYDLVLLNLIINIVNTSRKFLSSLYDAYDGCVCRNVSCCQHCFPTIFLLAVRSVVISLRYQAFFRFGRNSTFSHHPVRLFPKALFWLRVPKRVSGKVNVLWGSRWCCLYFDVSLFGWLISGNTKRAFYWVYNKLVVFLSLIVYKVNVCGSRVRRLSRK